jgi:hypothetical protein
VDEISWDHHEHMKNLFHHTRTTMNICKTFLFLQTFLSPQLPDTQTNASWISMTLRLHFTAKQDAFSNLGANKAKTDSNDEEWERTYVVDMLQSMAAIPLNAADWVAHFAQNSPVSLGCKEKWAWPVGSLAFGSLMFTRIVRAMDRKEATKDVDENPSRIVARDSRWGESVFATTYLDKSTSTVESGLVRMSKGSWEEHGSNSGWPGDNVVDTDNGPSAADTKEWMTRLGILPLLIAPGSQPSSNPYYTHSVYIQKDGAAIRQYVKKHLGDWFPACIQLLISDYF